MCDFSFIPRVGKREERLSHGAGSFSRVSGDNDATRIDCPIGRQDTCESTANSAAEFDFYAPRVRCKVRRADAAQLDNSFIIFNTNL